MDLRAMATVLRSGDVRTRLAAARDGQRAVRLAMTAAAVDCGLLDALADSEASTHELAGRLGFSDLELLSAFLRALEAVGLVKRTGNHHRLTRQGRSVQSDAVARAAYSGFGDFHTGVYRGLPAQLRGGPGRDDVTRRADTIAQLSEATSPFVEALLRRELRSRAAGRVLDVGCGTGLQLAIMLDAAGPGARGLGIELDAEPARLARERFASLGLGDRTTVLTGDATTVLAQAPGPHDVALVSNVVYYVPKSERTALLRRIRDVMAPAGLLIVVTTAATESSFSRHFDLLLRAQQGAMELPDMDELAAQLRAAGFAPAEPKQIAPGEPLMALLAEAAADD